MLRGGKIMDHRGVTPHSLSCIQRGSRLMGTGPDRAVERELFKLNFITRIHHVTVTEFGHPLNTRTAVS